MLTLGWSNAPAKHGQKKSASCGQYVRFSQCIVPNEIPIQSLDTVSDGQTWFTDQVSDSSSILVCYPTFSLTYRDPTTEQNFYTIECY